jgi:hypothetical protein
MFAGLFVRLLAVIFSKGYMMIDDHFLIVEVAGSWADGFDAKAWLPWTEGNHGPGYISLLYVGSVWLFFEGLQYVGVSDPEEQMMWLRLLHAFYSMFIIYFGYKIVEKLSDWKTARLAGLILALLAFMPNFSVRQLPEMVCIPPLLASAYFLILGRSKQYWKYALFAGIAAGIAIGIRYQSGLIVLGMGIALIFEKRFKSTVIFGVMGLLIFAVTQLPDYYLWHKPFAHLEEYIRHNLAYKDQYVTGPWHKYIWTLLGFLIPPISVFLVFGMARRFKKDLVLILGILIFLVIHSIFPNKQERFILPIIPFIIISGLVGWRSFQAHSSFWQKRGWVNTFCWSWFWTINVVAMLVFTLSYSHKSHVESMLWLGRQPDFQNFVQEYSHADHAALPPRYYVQNWQSNYVIDRSIDIEFQRERQLVSTRQATPNYVLFYQQNNLEERVYQLQEIYGPLQFMKKFDPSRLDKLLHRLNPHNKLEEIYVYKVMPVKEKRIPKYLE